MEAIKISKSLTGRMLNLGYVIYHVGHREFYAVSLDSWLQGAIYQGLPTQAMIYLVYDRCPIPDDKQHYDTCLCGGIIEGDGMVCSQCEQEWQDWTSR